MVWSCVMDYSDVFIRCLNDGTHSLQRTHWWASNIMWDVLDSFRVTTVVKNDFQFQTLTLLMLPKANRTILVSNYQQSRPKYHCIYQDLDRSSWICGFVWGCDDGLCFFWCSIQHQASSAPIMDERDSRYSRSTSKE